MSRRNVGRAPAINNQKIANSEPFGFGLAVSPWLCPRSGYIYSQTAIFDGRNCQPKTERLFALETAMKICPHCQQAKPDSEFTARKWNRCKECVATYNREWKAANKNRVTRNRLKYEEAHRKEINERSERYRKEHPERRKEIQAKYREAHREELRKASQAYHKKHVDRERAANMQRYWDNRERYLQNGRERYQANKEQEHKRRQKYYQENPDKARKQKRRYRARKHAAPGSGFTDVEFVALCERYGNQCLRCGCNDVPLERDHIIPLTKGGADRIENIQPLCKSCNSSKGTKTIDYRGDDNDDH